MRLKLRFLTIFLVSFAAIFAVLNSRFAYANIRFWFLAGTIPENIVYDGIPARSKVASPKKQLPDNAVLVLEKLGVSAPIVFGIGEDPKQIYSGLERGVVHYSKTPKPGEEGVSVVLGHSSAYPWYKGNYGSVFALLGKLKPGDIFYIRYEDGHKFAYSVKQSVVFNPFANDFRLQEIEANPKESIVLISCWPIGTNYRRIAVQAELI